MMRNVSEDNLWEMITRVDSTHQFCCVSTRIESPLKPQEKKQKKSQWKEVGGRKEGKKKRGQKDQESQPVPAATIYAALARRHGAKKKGAGSPLCDESEKDGYYFVPSFLAL